MAYSNPAANLDAQSAQTIMTAISAQSSYIRNTIAGMSVTIGLRASGSVFGGLDPRFPSTLSKERGSQVAKTAPLRRKLLGFLASPGSYAPGQIGCRL